MRIICKDYAFMYAGIHVYGLLRPVVFDRYGNVRRKVGLQKKRKKKCPPQDCRQKNEKRNSNTYIFLGSLSDISCGGHCLLRSLKDTRFNISRLWLRLD